MMAVLVFQQSKMRYRSGLFLFCCLYQRIRHFPTDLEVFFNTEFTCSPYVFSKMDINLIAITPIHFIVYHKLFTIAVNLDHRTVGEAAVKQISRNSDRRNTVNQSIAPGSNG